ncbi:MAG: PilZ domain-containing protein [Halieaceae bacterium]|jgi:hypothetical protein|nr:PilZ domain-containing protein [Halieaceae bacterium]
MSSDKRRFLRLPVESRVFIELESPPPGSIGPGKVARCDTLEVSKAGLRARIAEPVTVGAILQIGVELPGETEPFYLVGQVRWRMRDKEVPDAWLAGFEILNAQGSDIEHWENALQVMDERVPPA